MINPRESLLRRQWNTNISKILDSKKGKFDAKNNELFEIFI